MKSLLRLLCLAGLTAGCTVSAQPTTDDFSNPATWQAISNANLPKGAGTTTIDGKFNYVVGSPTYDDAAGRVWIPRVGSTLSGWVVQVEVDLSSLALADDQYTNLQIGASFGTHSFLNSIDWYKTDTGTLNKGFEAYKDSTTVGSRYVSTLGATTLKLGFTTSGSGTLVAAFYDSGYAVDDGMGTGYRIYATSTNILSTWGMGASDKFNIILIGGSGDNNDIGSGPAIAAGVATFDTFASSGLEARAVPEPSTYAAIIGLLALGFALYRRRG